MRVFLRTAALRRRSRKGRFFCGGVQADCKQLRAKLDITEDYRSDFNHGEKGASYQKYIVLHDTEVDGSAASIVNSWESSGNKVASQFIVNKDGSIVQCVPMDAIAHHAGYGDAGHNSGYGVPEDGRDDKKEPPKLLEEHYRLRHGFVFYWHRNSACGRAGVPILKRS